MLNYHGIDIILCFFHVYFACACQKVDWLNNKANVVVVMLVLEVVMLLKVIIIAALLIFFRIILLN